jgi:uncharacterized protein (TIGR03118 family)
MNKKVAQSIPPSFVRGLALYLFSTTAIAGTVVQTNLVSDVPGLAANTDPNLQNPWGISFSSTSPFWVSDQAANVATLYSGAGVASSTVVSVPGGPTGQVFNSAGAGNFLVGGTAASFIFDTLGGAIYGWNGGAGSTAQLEATTPGASFTGLAIDSNASGNFVYAANSGGTGGIDVFNSSWAPVTLSGSFTDPNLPSGYVPYNIQNINGDLYVEYENPSSQRTLGAGVVSVFNANGDLITELISAGGQLEAPWGIVIAPTGFFGFSGDLLVGNFGNGEINAFNPTTGAFIGTLTDSSGNPIVNQDLWALAVRPSGSFNSSAVYFDAGIDHQTEGLFGELTSTPEPGSIVLGAFGCAAIGLLLARRRKLGLSPNGLCINNANKMTSGPCRLVPEGNSQPETVRGLWPA